MKHQDLKDKMDNIEHTFDKEVLWANINKNDKKRRLLFWVMTLFLAVLLVFIGIVNRDSTLLQKSIKSNNSVEIANNKTAFQNFKSKGSASVNSANKPKSISDPQLSTQVNDLKIDQVISPLTLKSLSPSKVSSTAKNIEGTASSLKNANIDSLSLNRTIGLQTTTSLYTNAEKENDIETALYQLSKDKIDPALYEISSKRTIEVLDGKMNNEPASLSKKPIYLVHSDTSSIDLSILSLPNPIDETSTHTKRNSLKFYAGIGYDNQRFSNNDYGYFRKGFEKNLESRSLSFCYERVLWKKFYLKSSLMYVLNQTHVTNVEVDTTWYLNAQKKTVKSWSGNSYDLYNKYRRIDAIMDIGYALDIGKSYTFKPSIGVGFNVWHNEDGDVWDINHNLVKLQSLNEYKNPSNRFVVYAFSIEKLMIHDYTVGLSLSTQSWRTLANKNFIEHYINPINFQISLGKQF